MAVTTARIAHNAVVAYSTDSAGAAPAYVNVGEVTALKLPDMELEMHEGQHLGSAFFSKEKVPGLRDLGEASFTVNYSPTDATHIALIGYNRDRTLVYWKITLPLATGAAGGQNERYGFFSAYVSKVSPGQMNDQGTLSMTFTLTYTPGVADYDVPPGVA